MRVRRSLLLVGLTLLLAVSVAAAQTLPESESRDTGASAAGPPCGGRQAGHGEPARVRCGRQGQESAGMGGSCCRGGHRGGHGRAEMRTIWELIDGHEAIERQVEKIPGGVRTTTTATDSELVTKLQRHAAEMAELVESGGRIRMWDPLFAELLAHSDELRMEVVEIENGVVVTETSERPEVAELIRAHAAKVSEFVERGREAYFEPTPLPEGYAPR